MHLLHPSIVPLSKMLVALLVLTSPSVMKRKPTCITEMENILDNDYVAYINTIIKTNYCKSALRKCTDNCKKKMYSIIKMNFF